MRRIILSLLLASCTILLQAQTKMRPLQELINTEDPAWPLVQDWIAKATNTVEILPVDATRGREALFNTQVTSRSPMGAIVLSSGGLLIDHGWIRVLGSGSPRLPRSLPDWNKGRSLKEFGERPGFPLVADDAIGGFFAINGGALGSDPGKLYYLSPDNRNWEPLDITYTEFLQFCFTGNLEKFYEGKRWSNWKADLATLAGDQGFSFFPYLWTKEGKDINQVSRKAVPIGELYTLYTSLPK